MKKRLSLYFEDEELEAIERAKERLSYKIGMPISRNSYIRHLIFEILKNDAREIVLNTDRLEVG